MGNFGDRFERDVLLAKREERGRQRKRYLSYAVVILGAALLLTIFRKALLPLMQYVLQWKPGTMQGTSRAILVQDVQLVFFGCGIVSALIVIYDRVKYGPKR
jgi:hypothetical protein